MNILGLVLPSWFTEHLRLSPPKPLHVVGIIIVIQRKAVFRHKGMNLLSTMRLAMSRYIDKPHGRTMV